MGVIWMAYYIAHASLDERGRANSGQAGDQTGREVFIRQWYNSNWNVMLRPKNPEIGKKACNAAIYIATSNIAGYDQYQRNTLRAELKKVNYDYKKLTTKCETDCSAFCTVVYECAGYNMDSCYMALGNGEYNAPVTQTMRRTYTATGQFTAYTDAKYLTSAVYLQPGDVLVRESGHTCIYIGTSTAGFPDVSSAAKPETHTAVNKKFIINTKTDPLNCRAEPNGYASILGKFNKGVVVAASKMTTGWYYVTNGSLSGWVSADYLKEYIEQTTPAVSTPVVKKEEETVDLSKLTDKECYHILERAQKYAATLAMPLWAEEEFEKARKDKVTDGSNPCCFATRYEVALMVNRKK